MGHPFPARSFALPPVKKTMSPSQSTSTQLVSPSNLSSPLKISIPQPKNIDTNNSEPVTTLSSSLPSASLPPSSPSQFRKSHLERQRSKFDLLFNGTLPSPTLPSLIHESEATSPSSGFCSTVPIPESHPLLQSCYATIANLRVEVDRWQTRCREAQGRAQASDEASYSVIAERNLLQQRILEAEQENNTFKSRAASLSGEVDTLDIEIDKLRRENHRLRKMAYRQEECDNRIAELETLLSDSQRHATSADTRFNRLQLQYDTLKKAHRKLQQSSQRGGADAEVYEKIAWLRESNDKLRKSLSEVVTMTTGPNTIQQQATTLVGVVNQLIDANGRLKSELLGYCDLISEYKAENQHMKNQVRSLSPPAGLALTVNNPPSPNPSVRPRLRRRSSVERPRTMPDSSFLEHPTLLDELSRIETPRPTLKQSRSTIMDLTKGEKNKEFNMKRPSGIFTTTIPMQHLYQDNWMSCTDDSEVEEPLSRMLTPVPGRHRRNISITSSVFSDSEYRTLSTKDKRLSVPVQQPETLKVPTLTSRHSLIEPTKPTIPSLQFPITTLVEVADGLLDRLQASDPKCLNRKLQRSFNLLRLAPISNEVINNIKQNISLLSTRFAYLRVDTNPPPTKPSHHRTHSQPIEHMSGNFSIKGIHQLPTSKTSEYDVSQQKHFLELVNLVEKLLHEVAETRTNFNHLSMTYVEKMSSLAEDQTLLPKAQQWPKLLSLQKLEATFTTPQTNNKSPIESAKSDQFRHHRRSASNPDTLVRLSRAPMQIRNGVVDYTPQQAISVLPVVACSSTTSSLSTLDATSMSSTDTLRRLIQQQKSSIPTNPISSSMPSPPQAAAIVSIDATEAPRAAVVYHNYSLTGVNSSPALSIIYPDSLS